MNRSFIVVLLLVFTVFTGCEEDLNLTQRSFPCESDSECLLGTKCGPGPNGVCVLEEGSGEGSEPVVSTTPSEGDCPRPSEAYRATLTSGLEHLCAIREEHLLYCWGSNGSGQLGLGMESPSFSTPAEVLGDHRWVHVSAGRDHTCGITENGELYCWGDNSAGQLGDGTTSSQSEPTLIAEGIGWTSVTAGSSMTCGVTEAAALYCWGSDDLGRLGTGTWNGPNQLTPVQVGVLGTRWLTVFLALYHGCGLQEDGSLWCWAGNGYGEQGTGEPTTWIPTRVEATTECWRDGSLSFSGTFALDEHMELHGFGQDGSRRLNLDDGAADTCKDNESTMCAGNPTPVYEPGPWRSVALAWWHGAGVKADGTLWGWGGNNDGEGPLGTPEASIFPAQEISIDEAQMPFDVVVIGQNHTCVRDSHGDLWCAGRNHQGQLGRGFDGGAVPSFGPVLF